MVPRLVPEISSLDAFCDGGAGAAGIGDSRSWIGPLPVNFCKLVLPVIVFVIYNDNNNSL